MWKVIKLYSKNVQQLPNKYFFNQIGNAEALSKVMFVKKNA